MNESGVRFRGRPLIRATIGALGCVGLLGAGLIAAAAAPASAGAPHMVAPPVSHLRAQLQAAGYAVGEPIRWEADSVVLAVDDAAPIDPSWPTWRVFVFRDPLAAAAARERAAATTTQPASGGPQLLAGYSSSTWRDNLAIVQRATDVAASFPVAVDCLPNPTLDDPAPMLASSVQIDPRLLAALTTGGV